MTRSIFVSCYNWTQMLLYILEPSCGSIPVTQKKSSFAPKRIWLINWIGCLCISGSDSGLIYFFFLMLPKYIEYDVDQHLMYVHPMVDSF